MLCTGLWTACADTPGDLCATWGLSCEHRLGFAPRCWLTSQNFRHRLCVQESPPPGTLLGTHESYPHTNSGLSCLLAEINPAASEPANRADAASISFVGCLQKPRGATSPKRMIRSCVRPPFSASPRSGRQLTSWPPKRGRQRPAAARQAKARPATRTRSSSASPSSGHNSRNSTPTWPDGSQLTRHNHGGNSAVHLLESSTGRARLNPWVERQSSAAGDCRSTYEAPG